MITLLLTISIFVFTPMLAVNPDQQQQGSMSPHEVFLEWKAAESGTTALTQALRMTDKSRPEFHKTIAKILKESLDGVPIYRKDATNGLNAVKTILESRNPDIFMQFPDIFKELATMPDSADSIRRLLKYPNFIYAEDKRSVFQASHRPHLFPNRQSLNSIIVPIFKESDKKVLQDIETGKLLLNFLLEPQINTFVDLKWPLMWTSRLKLENEFNQIFEKMKSILQYEGMLVGFKETLESQPSVFLNRFLTVENNFFDMYFHAWAIGDQHIISILTQIHDSMPPVSETLWPNLQRDAKGHVNFQELLQGDLPNGITEYGLVHYAILFDRPDVIRILSHKTDAVLAMKAYLRYGEVTNLETADAIMDALIRYEQGPTPGAIHVLKEAVSDSLDHVSDSKILKLILKKFYLEKKWIQLKV